MHANSEENNRRPSQRGVYGSNCVLWYNNKLTDCQERFEPLCVNKHEVDN